MDNYLEIERLDNELNYIQTKRLNSHIFQLNDNFLNAKEKYNKLNMTYLKYDFFDESENIDFDNEEVLNIFESNSNYETELSYK